MIVTFPAHFQQISTMGMYKWKFSGFAHGNFKIQCICSQKFWIFVCLFHVLHTLEINVSIKFHKDLYIFFSINAQSFCAFIQQNLVEVEWNQLHWQIPYTWEHRIGRLFFKDPDELWRDGLNSTFFSVHLQCKSNATQVQMCTLAIGCARPRPLHQDEVFKTRGT